MIVVVKIIITYQRAKRHTVASRNANDKQCDKQANYRLYLRHNRAVVMLKNRLTL